MKKKIQSLDEFIEQEHGKLGTYARNQFEAGYQDFKVGHLLQEARITLGLTQEELAQKCGTNKGYISKIENNIKEVRLSTLQKIVEQGLSGTLELRINVQHADLQQAAEV